MGLLQSAANIGPNNFANDIEIDRLMVGMDIGDDAVLYNFDDFFVVPVSGQHQVQVYNGRGKMPSRTAPTARGAYGFASSGSLDTLTVPGVQANPYIATLILFVADPQYGSIGSLLPGSQYLWVSGNPASSPSAPTDAQISTAYPQPGSWCRLAEVRINAADTGAIPAGQITDRRPWSIRDVGPWMRTQYPGSRVFGPGSGPIDNLAIGIREGFRGAADYLQVNSAVQTQILKSGWYNVEATCGINKDSAYYGSLSCEVVPPAGRRYPPAMSLGVDGRSAGTGSGSAADFRMVAGRQWLAAGTMIRWILYVNQAVNLNYFYADYEYLVA